MKLFNKIKSILFDDEEMDDNREEVSSEPIPNEVLEEEVEPAPTQVKRAEFVDDFELPKRKEVAPKIEERDVFTSANTFNFPVDVEEDDFKLDDFPKRNQNALENTLDTKRVNVEKYSIKKQENTDAKKEPFKASPIISPIYGIMDKNYKKNDVLSKKPVEKVKPQPKVMDLDEVRKKAYGTLEDEIESTLETPITEFYNSESKPIEKDLLFEEEIPAKNIDDLLIEEDDKKSVNKVEESLLNETFKLDEVIDEMKKSTKSLEETDTDLFNLIDSMYEDKEN